MAAVPRKGLFGKGGQDMLQTMLVQERIKVRGYDIDVMGIVSNTVYVKYFEDLRHSFLDRYMPYEEMFALGISPMLLRTEINYHAPLTIQDAPLGEVWVTHMGRTKWIMAFRISSGDTLHCTGSQTGCAFDLKLRRPCAFPGKLLEAYKTEVTRPENSAT